MIEQNAKTKLINLLQDTDTIYSVLYSVSKNGLSRICSFYIVDSNKEIVNINYYISVLLGYKFNKSCDGLIIKGNVIDMGNHVGYHVVNSLLSELGINKKIFHRWI